MKKYLFKFSLLLIGLVVIMYACKRTVLIDKPTNVFDVATAKEWYYGTFRKSSAYFELDGNSPFLNKSKNSNLRVHNLDSIPFKKYPKWSAANSFVKNGYQIVEMPLVYNKTTILLPGMAALSSENKERIANASLNKVVFIKTPTNKIITRLVTMVPKFSYAQAKNFDISNNKISGIDNQFDGFIMVRKWNESSFRLSDINHGQTLRRFSFYNSSNGNSGKSTKQKKSTTHRTNDNDCPLIWVPKMYRCCVVAGGGDDPNAEGGCEVWSEPVESPTQGTWEEDPNCQPVDDFDPIDLCELYGIGCLDGDDYGDGDGEGEEENSTNSTSPCDNADSLKNNNEYKEKFAALKNKTNEIKEHGYTFKLNTNGLIDETEITGVDSAAGIDFVVNNKIDGFIHSHYTGLLSIFSPDDLYAIAELYLNNKMVDPSKFSAGVVTANNTQYLIMIEDLSKFQQFASKLTGTGLNAYSIMFENLYKISPGNDINANEKAFLQYIQQSNSGLKLFKGNDSFNEWQPKKVDTNNNVVNNPC